MPHCPSSFADVFCFTEATSNEGRGACAAGASETTATIAQTEATVLVD